MRRALVTTVVAGAVACLMFFVGLAVAGWLQTEAAAGDYTRIYWMSAAAWNLDSDSALDFCVTQSYHLGNHVDVNADDTGDSTPCYIVNTNSISVTARTRAYIPQAASKVIANVYVTSGQYADGCDYVQGRTTSKADGRFRGTERWIHARSYGSVPYTYGVIASSSGPMQISSLGDAWTTQDTNCSGGWSGPHIHQGNKDSTCSSVDALVVDTTPPLPDVWNLTYYINRFVYYEGDPAC